MTVIELSCRVAIKSCTFWLKTRIKSDTSKIVLLKYMISLNCWWFICNALFYRGYSNLITVQGFLLLSTIQRHNFIIQKRSWAEYFKSGSLIKRCITTREFFSIWIFINFPNLHRNAAIVSRADLDIKRSITMGEFFSFLGI